MMDAIITKTAKGAYMAQGNDGKGNKLTTLLGEQKALDAIKAGIAKRLLHSSIILISFMLITEIGIRPAGTHRFGWRCNKISPF